MSDATGVSLTKTRFEAGIWEGELRLSEAATEPPEIVVTLLGQPVRGQSQVSEGDQQGLWTFRFSVPSEVLGDGVQTFVFSLPDGGPLLNSLTLIAGDEGAEDFRAEMEVLRQELDLLKRAFRRHCVETGAA